MALTPPTLPVWVIDGSATIQVSGGVAPYDYSYNQGNTLENTLVAEGAENGMGINSLNTAFQHYQCLYSLW